MEILSIEAVKKNDIAVRRNSEINPSNYFNAIFKANEKTYTATIRTSTYHVAECINEDNKPVRMKEETERKLITAINQYNKKHDR